MIYDGTDTLTGGGDDRVAAVMTAPGRAGVRRVLSQREID